MSEKVFKNGGFPPLLYCSTKDNKNTQRKERSYPSSIINNINIRQILSNNKKTFILDPNKNADELEIISEL
jgi:hypothetical protein